MSTPLAPLPPELAPDLVWDNPQRPDGLQADDWQGIRSIRLEIQDTIPKSAILTVFLLTPPAQDDEYTLEVSGPDTLPFTPNAIIIDGANSRFEAIFSEIGERGTYFVTLVPDDAPTLPIHPFFATASFTFTIDCETGDCRQSNLQNPLARLDPGAPAVDLLTKDYDGFVQLLGDRIRVQNPDWADLSPASFERVLVEILAHHADMLSYYQDRVANEAFLDTASQRYSLRQHGVLLGYELFDGEAATTLLSFRVSANIVVPDRLAVNAPRRADEAPVVFSVVGSELFTPGRDPELLTVAQWPEAFTARVPVGATSLLLLGSHPDLEVGQRVALVEFGVPTQVRTLTRVDVTSLPGWVDDPNDPLVNSPLVAVTRIHWEEGLTSELLVWDEVTAASPLSVYGNLVDAVHGEWKQARVLSAPTAPSDVTPDIPLTEQSAVIARSPLGQWQLRALRLPQGPVLFDRVGEQLVPAVEVTLDDRPWFRQPHLHRSQPFDRHFVAVSDNDGRLWLQFGDGERGRAIELTVDPKIGVESARLAGADELRILYRIGPNLAGNIDIGKLNEIAPRQIINDDEVVLTGIEAVTNVTPGAGGRQPETLDAARLAIPASLRQASRLRAVTVEDYARVVELNVPEVERATARSLGEPFGTILVLVDPKDDAELTDELKSTIERVLERTRMVGREVLVRAAEAVPLDVELAVCVRPGFAKHEVKQAVLAALRPGDPERPGFFHPNRLTFGQDVELGDVLAEAQKVPGVLAVKATVFRRLRHEVPPVLPRIELGITEVARLDGDDLNPENGRLIVLVPGLDEVPEDLFKFELSSELSGEEAAS